MSDARQLYSALELEEMTARIFEHWGVPQADAAIVAKSLLAANLRGVDTHGVARIPSYIERFRRGLVETKPKIAITSRMPFAAAGLERSLRRPP
jgi:LDH2 family malate/lactate/ureidoglycolate dehydrogenase